MKKMRRSSSYAALRLVTAALTLGVAAFAHFTWVFTAASALEPGKTVTVGIAHGHEFPHSEESVNPNRLSFFAIAPAGARTNLSPVVTDKVVTAAYAVKEPGLHRIVLIQDRGVSSRTPSGLKSGGRDKHPGATQSFRTFRSAVAYARTAGAPAGSLTPVGLEFELTGDEKQGVWHLLLLRNGKPAAGADIEVLFAGLPDSIKVGRTGPDGKLEYRLPSEAKGPAMFSAELRQPPPPGEKYDFVNYGTSLSVNWDGNAHR